MDEAKERMICDILREVFEAEGYSVQFQLRDLGSALLMGVADDKAFLAFVLKRLKVYDCTWQLLPAEDEYGDLIPGARPHWGMGPPYKHKEVGLFTSKNLIRAIEGLIAEVIARLSDRK